MKSGRLLLTAILLTGLGLVVLPQAVSLFEGQHEWYAKEDMNNQCTKCHADIAAELQLSGEHSGFQCTACHQVNKVPSGAHAAATVACIDCHNSVVQEFQNDVHLPYYNAAMNDTLMTGPNEACVGCHTHTQVNITFVEKQTLEFTATALGGGQWDIGQMTAK